MPDAVIKYIQKGAYFDDEVSIDVSINNGTSDEILLIVPGVDGSVNGYENKYKRIADNINSKFGATVIRMSNPHNMAGYHLRNLFEILDFIEKNYDMAKKRLHIVGHSLGGYMISEVASMYDYIDKVLLINPTTLLNNDSFNELKKRPKELNLFLIGDQDPSFDFIDLFKEVGIVNIERGADHHFSGSSFDAFLKAPAQYIFKM